MVCIYCQGETSVINSRSQKRSNNIWRRRQCIDCRAVFTTSETPDLIKSLLVSSHKHLQPFSRDKLFLSIHDSLMHRKSAVADATALTDTIIGHLYSVVKAGSLHPADIIQITGKILQRFDKAAATHYQAYHPSEL